MAENKSVNLGVSSHPVQHHSWVSQFSAHLLESSFGTTIRPRRPRLCRLLRSTSMGLPLTIHNPDSVSLLRKDLRGLGVWIVLPQLWALTDDNVQWITIVGR